MNKGDYINCVYCNAPLLVEYEMALRLKYHPACKRDVDRERAGLFAANRADHQKTCEVCLAKFQSKRSDARTCSPKCRTALHRKAKAPARQPAEE